MVHNSFSILCSNCSTSENLNSSLEIRPRAESATVQNHPRAACKSSNLEAELIETKCTVRSMCTVPAALGFACYTGLSIFLCSCDRDPRKRISIAVQPLLVSFAGVAPSPLGENGRKNSLNHVWNRWLDTDR
jgi:hypothetical protein